MNKAAPVEKKTNYRILMFVLFFGAAMAVLGTQEVNKEYSELKALRQPPLTPEQIMLKRKQMVQAFHGESEMIRRPMVGRASFSAERYQQAGKEQAGEQVVQHDKMAIKDLVRKVVPSFGASSDAKVKGQK